MDPETVYPATEMKQKLIPTANDLQTSVAMDIPQEKLQYGFPPSPPHTRVYAAAAEPMHRPTPDRCGSAFRMLALCFIGLGVIAGFSVLYLQMRDLQHQVLELKAELVFEENWDPVSYLDTETTGNAPSGSQAHEDEPTEQSDEKHDAQIRARRSVGGSSNYHSGRLHQSQLGTHPGHHSSHVIPRLDNTQSIDRAFSTSEWFSWSGAPANAHSQIPLHRTGNYFVIPHSGYYHVYSQIQIVSKVSDDIKPRGHGLFVKKGCGYAPETTLTTSLTTPTHGRQTNATVLSGGPFFDSNYVAGVFYFQQNDFVGVKPVGATIRSRVVLTADTCYFGIILVSKSQQSHSGPRCIPRY